MKSRALGEELSALDQPCPHPSSWWLPSYTKGIWRDLATALTIVLQATCWDFLFMARFSRKALHMSAVFPSAPPGSVFSCSHCIDAQIKAETGSGLAQGKSWQQMGEALSLLSTDMLRAPGKLMAGLWRVMVAPQK